MASKGPHLCPFPGCGKSFSGSWSLTRHLRKHNNLKPFKCSYCEKEFIEKCALSRHEQTHFEDHPWSCDFPDCGRRFKLKEYRDHHRKQHPRTYVYQQPSQTSVGEGDDMAGYDNKPSSDQLRHRLVKLTIRHKEQLLRAEDLRRTFQEAFNDCFKTLEDLIRAPTHDMQAPYIISNGIANVNLQKTCLSPRREQAVRETLCRHSYLAANDPFGPSDLNGFHQVESATGALLALQNDTSASQDRSNGLTAGIILERLHGTISNMSSDSSIGKVKKRSRIGAQISAAADSRSDADGRCPPAAEGLDSSLAAGIVDMLSSLNDNEASMPAIEQIYSHLVVRERQLVQENLPILQHMHQGHSRAKRSFEVMNNGNSDHAVPFPVTAVASSIDQLAFGIAEDYTAALHNTQVASTGPGTVGAVIASTHQQPSANLQNVLSWLVAWNSKKNNS